LKITELKWEKIREGWEHARIKGHRTQLHIIPAPDWGQTPPGQFELWSIQPVSHIGTFASVDEAKAYARTYVGDDEKE